MKRTIFNWAVISLFVISIFVLNCTFNVCSDDTFYGLSGTFTEDGVALKYGSLKEVFLVNFNDLNRPIVHLFVRLFCGYFPKWLFNLCNALMAGSLILLILHTAKSESKTKHNNVRATIFTLLLVVFILFKGESYLWVAGSVNYLWSAVVALATVCLWNKFSKHDIPKGRIALYISLLPCIFLSGWTQEAFVVPLGFAMGCSLILSLIKERSLSLLRILFLCCYGIGFLLLAGFGNKVGRFTATERNLLWFIGEQIKILFALKGLWIIGIYWLFCKDKKKIIQRNAFELLVILGCYLLISIVGFNGERSLWCGNLFAIIICVREINLPKYLTVISFFTLLILYPILWWYGFQIREQYQLCIDLAKRSASNVSCQNRINTGILNRFFHQSVGTWNTESGHNVTFSQYHGFTETLIILSSELYNDLYLEDNFCKKANQLPQIEPPCYTTPTSNAIVIPLKENVQIENLRVTVDYNLPSDWKTWINLEMAQRQMPTAVPENVPQLLQTTHGNYLLIAKRHKHDAYIKTIRFYFPK